MKLQKRIAAIHDFSCFGRCSLTVALPLISAAGIEVSAIPTAVFSTHTGGFKDFTFRDLTKDIEGIANHWKENKIEFDGLYSGFLGSFEQIEIVEKVFKMFKTEKNIVVVDPVMADHGKLYSIFPENFPQGMARLSASADVLVPNMTEACLLTNKEYKAGDYTKDYVKDLLKSLSDLGAKNVVLTGVHFNDEELGAASYNRESGEVNYFMSKRYPRQYHGTGDVFASALTAALISGKEINKATEIAVNFTVASIKRSEDEQTDPRYGVNFEAGLSSLTSLING